MRGYLSVPQADSGTVTVDGRIGIYRDPGDTQEIIARTNDREAPLGIRDVTVSRPDNGTPPVVLEPRQSRIEIHNKANSNGVTVRCDGEQTDLEKGLATTVDDTATVTIGYQTTLRLRVEQEAKQEINVQGTVGGDVVAGDQTNVDKSTNVTDSVVNRSEISGEGGADVDDSVLNRSRVNGDSQTTSDESDTKKHCETHDRMYTGQTCPECAAEEAKYCIFCGTTIPAVASVCPECGEQLPDTA